MEPLKNFLKKCCAALYQKHVLRRCLSMILFAKPQLKIPFCARTCTYVGFVCLYKESKNVTSQCEH